VRVRFYRLNQKSQVLGTDPEHLVSEVEFDLEAGGKRHSGLRAIVKQAAGSSYGDQLEVGPPIGYDGPFNQQAFAECAEKYYRDLIGAAGHGIRIEGSASVTMVNNAFEAIQEFEI
jgi:hypothetical protein